MVWISFSCSLHIRFPSALGGGAVIIGLPGRNALRILSTVCSSCTQALLCKSRMLICFSPKKWDSACFVEPSCNSFPFSCFLLVAHGGRIFFYNLWQILMLVEDELVPRGLGMLLASSESLVLFSAPSKLTVVWAQILGAVKLMEIAELLKQ